jgi:glucosamine--fructose-6-phosphate aminotransferase (isomerizing)
VSQSGETADLLKILKMFKKSGYPTFGIVNVVGSQIAKVTGCGCYMNAGSEQSVPSTKSFLTSIVCQLLMVLWFANDRLGSKFIQLRQKLCFSLLALQCFIKNMLKGEIVQKSQELAEILFDVETLLVLGKGACLPIAKEAALKLKETTYIATEAMSAGDLKHGPIALIDSSKPGTSKGKLSIRTILMISYPIYYERQQT